MSKVDAIIQPIECFCELNQTETTVLVAEDQRDQTDNVEAFRLKPCERCTRYGQGKLDKIISDINDDALDQFGSKEEDVTGIYPKQFGKLEQLLVDKSRLKPGAEPKLVIGLCTPISK